MKVTNIYSFCKLFKRFKKKVKVLLLKEYMKNKFIILHLAGVRRLLTSVIWPPPGMDNTVTSFPKYSLQVFLKCYILSCHIIKLHVFKNFHIRLYSIAITLNKKKIDSCEKIFQFEKWKHSLKCNALVMRE